MATPTPPKAGGNPLTRKLGPLPTWAWAAIAVGGYLIYRQRKAAQAAAGTTATTSTAAPSPTAMAPTGFGYQGPGTSGFYPGSIPTGATAATSSPNSFVEPTGETQVGAGYLNSGGAPIVGADNNSYQYISNPANLNGLLAAGQSVYYQSQPGVFTPVTAQELAPPAAGQQGFQAPLYQQLPQGVS